MAFRFSLQAVLQHRMTREEQAQREFGEAKGRLETALLQLREIQEGIERRTREVREGMRKGINLTMRSLYESWIDSQRDLAQTVEKMAKQLAEEAERRRQKLIQAIKERMIIEKLRERELAEWQRDEARKEQKMFDEIAVRDFCMGLRTEKDADQTERIACS